MVTAEPAYLAHPHQEGRALTSAEGGHEQLEVMETKQEPVSLTESRTSDHGSEDGPASTSSPVSISDDDDDDDPRHHHHHNHNHNETTESCRTNLAPQSGRTEDNHRQQQQQQQDDDEEETPEGEPVKCSAVHTLERDMPDYDYSSQIDDLRLMILEHARENPGLYAAGDLQKCRDDSWFLARFLLRQKMNLLDAFEMLKQAMRFNNESLASHLRAEDFPAEFYQLGGIFPFGHDRKGNRMLYMRVRVHRKTPEIQAIVQAFIYHNIKRLDDEAQGKGISLVIDCTGGGLANADMETLLFIISTLKNYFPKGLSYFLVHEIPWILKPFWHLAKAWVPEEHRQLIKFSDARTITEFVARDQLPDYLGGRGRAENYKRAPENCTTLEQATKLWGIERSLMRGVFQKFRDHLPDATVARIEAYLAGTDVSATTGSDGDDDDDDDDTDDGLGPDQEQAPGQRAGGVS